MVKRYSHTAVVTVSTTTLLKGEWVKGDSSEVTLKGRYFPSNSGQRVKENADGKERVVHGEFSTKAAPVKNATRLRIDSIGLDVEIIRWEPFQSHSVIYV